MADDEMSRAEAASWLVRIANDLRSAGDMPLVRMNANGVETASMSLADELWLVAFCLVRPTPHGRPAVADDIVTRLHEEIDSLKADVQVLRDAITEIERLRAEVADWRLTVQAQEAVAEALRAVVAEKHAEIERLRAAGDALVAAIRNHDLTEAHLKAWEEARRG